MKDKHSKQITVLNDTVLESLGAKNEKEIVKNFITAGISLLGADYGFSFIKLDGAQAFDLLYKSPSTPFMPISRPRKKGIVARAFNSGKPQFVEDVLTKKFVRFDAKKTMRGVVVIPMQYKKARYGTLHLCFYKVKNFTTEEKSFCELLGSTAAQAITINRLYANLQDFKYTLDNTHDAMLMLDPKKLKILYANRVAINHLGIPEKKLLGKPVTELSTGIQLEQFQDIINAVIEKPNERRLFETEIALQGRESIPIEVSLEHVTKQGIPKQPRLLATIRNLTKEKAAETEVKRSLYYDKLTGLPNRTYITEELPKILEAAQAEGRQCGLLLIDVDKFKFMNDMLGHALGDGLLVEISRRIWDTVEKRDIVARTGGNEFTMVLAQIKSVQDVERVAEQIQTAFAEPFVVDDQEIFVSVSLGIGVFPGDGGDVQTLLRNVHAALRWVKEAGGGAFRLYYTDISSLSPNQLKLEQQLRHAIKRGQLAVYYQPQINLLSGKLSGADAFLRWNHPEHGLLLPEDFLSRVENSAFIVEIGYWLIHEAARQIREWVAQGAGTIPISIRLSQRQLTQPNVVGDVGRILTTAGVSPDLLSFEVGESMAIKHADLAMQVFTNFKLLGTHFTIGDFGRGYTSLSNLKRLPVDTIKIDHSFIQDMARNRHDRAIVAAMISLAHDMRMNVIAGGVSEDKQLQLLAKQGCDIAQGPYISQALLPNEFVAWVNQIKNARKEIA